MTNAALLTQIEKNIAICQKCRLFRAAKNPVPGEGNYNAELIFIGEAPGASEDATGRPFVGRAGNLLEKLLAKINYERKDVWIGNIIKHRPPENRDPLPDEVTACSQYLTMQLSIMKPILIVTLGRYAMNYFYPEGKISQVHGRVIQTNDKNIYPVYHPAAGLRNPEMLKALARDFMQIPKILENLKNPKGIIEDLSQDGQLNLF